MYRNILVPIAFDDGAEINGALDVAKALAEEGASITLLHVIEEVPSYAVSYVPQGFLAEARIALQTELQKLAADVPGGRSVVIDGHAGRTITDYAAQQGTDCIVIASHKPGMQDLLIGSTANRVVRHARCAVHVLR